MDKAMTNSFENPTHKLSTKSGRRVLHVFRAPVGGLFRHVYDLAKEQARLGMDVGILCDALTGGASDARFAELEKICTLGVTRVPMSRSFGRGDLAAYNSVKQHVQKMSPHIVHGHGAKGGAYVRLLPRDSKRSVFYTPHGGTLHFSWLSLSGALYLSLERMLRSRGDGIIFESAFSAKAYAKKIGKISGLSRIIPNGLSQADFEPLEKDEPQYDGVFIGELRKLKGVSSLIEAVAQINAQHSFRLAIVGAGADEEYFRECAKKAGIAHKIDFLGVQTAREAFSLGRMVIMPSLAESFPYVVLEAIASGRPLIATNVGGIPEIFGPHAGALVRPGDAGALKAAITNAMHNSSLTALRAGALTARASKHFAVGQMSDEICRFYRESAFQRQASNAASGHEISGLETIEA
jgi:glycosyltransferase involved in cell wall biosynthesis